jgi:hypothetical protein
VRGHEAGYTRGMTDDNVKNTLPDETDDHADSGMPRQLRTQADNDRALTRAEADIAGISTTPKMIYGEASGEPDEQKDRFSSTEVE